jgi:hypothetical protein
MSLRFIDGFDHYNSPTQKWTSSSGSPTYASASSRFGVGQYAKFNGSGIFNKGFDNQATWTIGAAVKFEGAIDNASLFFLRDNTTMQVTMGTTGSGALNVYRGDFNAGGTLLGTTANGVLSLNVWYFIELKTTINNTTGAYEVRLNGVNVLSGSGADTQAGTNAYVNMISVGSGNGAVSFDDLYVCDGAGGLNDTFLGDVRVDTILPTADGSTTDFTPSTGTDNYAMVDDATPDSDTTYVSSETLNHIDLYTFANLQSTVGAVHGIQTVLFARKDDAGSRSIAPAIKTGATTAVGDDFALAASYIYDLQIFETNPANSNAAWTISDVNSSEFGFKLTA